MANSGKINWENFNFIENLLIHCILNEREVPPESGVKFRIGKEDKDGEICLIFHIDREKNPLIVDEIPRPDYLIFYVKGNLCIFTIVEMKGKAEKNQKHGIEQITTFRDKLKKEIEKHLPSKFKFKIQGILLSPYNSDIPRKVIMEEEKRGFVIFPIQYSNKAELFGCISKINKLTDKHDPAIQANDSEFNLIENLLANKVLTKRKNDSFFAETFKQSKDRESVYLNYEFDKNDAYLAVSGDTLKLTLGIKEKNEKNETHLKTCFEKLEISLSNALQITKIANK